MDVRDTHAVLTVPQASLNSAMAELRQLDPLIRIMGHGESIEIYKEVGLPETVVSRFDIAKMTGTHGIGHTRMARVGGRQPWVRTRLIQGATNVWCIMGHYRTIIHYGVNCAAKIFESKPKMTLKWQPLI